MLSLVLAASLLGSEPPPKEYPGGPGEFCGCEFLERAPVFAGTAIGALAGGVIGSAAAIGMSAALDDAVGALALIALPPLFVATGAGVGAWSTGGADAAWGGAGAALIGAGTGALVIGLVVADEGSIAGSADATFVVELAVPPLLGAAAGASAAALLVQP